MLAKFHWSFGDLKDFDLGESDASKSVWRGSDVLSFNGEHCLPVLLHEPLLLDSFILQAEVSCRPDSFAGLVFGARDSDNYELVYISADNEWNLPNLQYDPIMNGSSTWQIYHGSDYQALVSVPSEEWVKLTLKIQSDSVSIFVGDVLEPQLIIPNLIHGNISAGKIGVWGYTPSYIRNLSVVPTKPTETKRIVTDYKKLVSESFVTEWLVSEPYFNDQQRVPESRWVKAVVEENGTLNLNRLYSTEKGLSVQTKSTFYIPGEQETVLSLGFSDSIRLWVNDEEVYQGDWRWNPPADDGRIRSDFAAVPVRWKAGLNTILTEITSQEVIFGWGQSIKTGLPKLTFLTE